MTAEDELLRALRQELNDLDNVDGLDDPNDVDELDGLDDAAFGTSFAPARSPDDPYVVCWRDLDVDTADAEIERLTGWVDWLVARYCIDHKAIPPCWAQHGALTEELSALRTLWEVCYTGDAAPADPATFHRELDIALRRLREWASRRGCTRTEHRDEHPPA